jgi:hypothetical protein
MTEQGQNTAASAEASGASTSAPPQEGRWARWRRKAHPMGKAYPVWIAAGLLLFLLLFAELIGWLIRHHLIGF